jgi:hypothetical protein
MSSDSLRLYKSFTAESHFYIERTERGSPLINIARALTLDLSINGRLIELHCSSHDRLILDHMDVPKVARNVLKSLKTTIHSLVIQPDF